VGRSVSLSLAAHAAFILAFLLLSATRQPLVVPQAARPVRLVTYLEPAAAPRPRAAVVSEPQETRAAPARIAPRVVPPTAAAARPPAAAPPAATVAVPRVVIPVPASAPPATRAEVRPTLSERLARRLAASAPAVSRQDETAAPRFASLPRPEPVAPAPGAEPAVPETPAQPPGTIAPVGYFPHAWYLSVLKERIFARWSPPSDFFQSRRPPAALVSFRIDRAGKLDGVTLKEGSGSARFDQSALAAVKGLGQVPPLPEQYREETLDVVIRFQNEQ
jgi:protein TonB